MGKFDVLGHMTYPLRYIEGEAGMPVDLSAYEEQIHECLKALVNNGCGLEPEHLRTAAEIREAIPNTRIHQIISGNGRRKPVHRF